VCDKWGVVDRRDGRTATRSSCLRQMRWRRVWCGSTPRSPRHGRRMAVPCTAGMAPHPRKKHGPPFLRVPASPHTDSLLFVLPHLTCICFFSSSSSSPLCSLSVLACSVLKDLISLSLSYWWEERDLDLLTGGEGDWKTGVWRRRSRIRRRRAPRARSPPAASARPAPTPATSRKEVGVVLQPPRFLCSFFTWWIVNSAA
jgi:hypothetical protein